MVSAARGSSLKCKWQLALPLSRSLSLSLSLSLSVCLSLSLSLCPHSSSVVSWEIEAGSLKAAGWSSLVQPTPSACWENLLTAAQWQGGRLGEMESARERARLHSYKQWKKNKVTRSGLFWFTPVHYLTRFTTPICPSLLSFTFLSFLSSFLLPS